MYKILDLTVFSSMSAQAVLVSLLVTSFIFLEKFVKGEILFSIYSYYVNGSASFLEMNKCIEPNSKFPLYNLSQNPGTPAGDGQTSSTSASSTRRSTLTPPLQREPSPSVSETSSFLASLIERHPWGGLQKSAYPGMNISGEEEVQKILDQDYKALGDLRHSLLSSQASGEKEKLLNV